MRVKCIHFVVFQVLKGKAIITSDTRQLASALLKREVRQSFNIDCFELQN